MSIYNKVAVGQTISSFVSKRARKAWGDAPQPDTETETRRR